MSKPVEQKSATIPVDVATTVGIREFRDHLSSYLAQVKAGGSLTITEHGRPIARIISQAYPPVMLELIARGDVTPATSPRTDYRLIKRILITGSTQDLIDEIR